MLVPFTKHYKCVKQLVTFVDIQNRGLDFPLRNTDEFVEQDAIEYLEKSYTFDAIICSDGIEHLSKKDGIFAYIN